MLSKILNKQYQVDFLKYGKSFVVGSAILMALSIVALFSKGLNKGIDFSGGILIEIRSEEAIDLSALRGNVSDLKLGDVSLQDLGNPRDIMIRVGLDESLEKKQVKKIELLKSMLFDIYGTTIEFRRVEFVGPTVGKELVRSGIAALVLAFFAILIYIWIRFSYRFGFGALAALIHDVVLVLGLFVILQLEFNLTSIAAILTIIGYSINDSVVIYDRIRENSRKYRSKKQTEIINRSINETLNRTILTAVTTVVALLSLAILGGPVLKSFSVSVLFGVIVGTYSSIYIATTTISSKSKKSL